MEIIYFDINLIALSSSYVFFCFLFKSFWSGISYDGKNSRFYKNDKWTKEAIDNKIDAVNKKDWNKLEGAYGGSESRVLYNTINLYKHKVIGKNALVIGSNSPWLEAILLAVGAKHVTTVEYNRILSTHPQVLRLRHTKHYINNPYNYFITYTSIYERTLYQFSFHFSTKLFFQVSSLKNLCQMDMIVYLMSLLHTVLLNTVGSPDTEMHHILGGILWQWREIGAS